MNSWRRLRAAWLARFGRLRNEDRLNATETQALCDEIQALLDLSCYAAAQAVAFAKQLERQMNELNTANREREICLAHEYQTLQAKLESLRTTIEQLHALLRVAKAKQSCNASRGEWESTNQMMDELLSSRDALELKESLRNPDGTFAGTEP